LGKRYKNFVFTFGALLISGLFLFPGPLFAQPTNVLVAAPAKSLTWFPAFLAKEKGFYKQESLDVDFIVMSPRLALQALVAGDLGYVTTLGSTIRAAFRGLPVRVVMTICEKPHFALIAKPGVKSLGELKGKVLGISSFGASTDTMARALLEKHRLSAGQDVTILAVGGGLNRLAALKSGAIDATLIEAPYNVMLEREGYSKILFVGDFIPSPIAGLGTSLDRIRKNPDEIRRLIRATLRGIQYAKANRQEVVRIIARWTESDAAVAEGSYEMAVQTWSSTGAPNPQALSVAMEEVKADLKLERAPHPNEAFEWGFVQR